MQSLLLLLLSSVALAASHITPSQITLYAWPISAPSPTSFAKVSIASSNSATLDSYKQPTAKDNEIVRVGLYDTSSKEWTGIATSAASFSAEYQKVFSLHLDSAGNVFHLGLSTLSKAAGTENGKGQKNQPTQKAQEDVVVEVIPIKEGAKPILNKPVVVSEDGKVGQEAEKDERSFLQRYWWVIVLFLVMQVVGGGGKE